MARKLSDPLALMSGEMLCTQNLFRPRSMLMSFGCPQVVQGKPVSHKLGISKALVQNKGTAFGHPQASCAWEAFLNAKLSTSSPSCPVRTADEVAGQEIVTCSGLQVSSPHGPVSSPVHLYAVSKSLIEGTFLFPSMSSKD